MMGRLGSALLALGLLSGALAKPKVGFKLICKLFLQNSGDVEFSAKKLTIPWTSLCFSRLWCSPPVPG